MKRVICTFLAVLLCGVFGCVSADSDRERFCRIAENLETGGSAYFISSSRNAGAALENLIKKSEETVWYSSLSPERQLKLQHLISCSELVGRLAGLHEIKGWGFSSAYIPGKERRFRNRIRLLLPSRRDGVIWNLFSGKNQPLQKYLNDLPEDTFFAGAVELSPEVLTALLKIDPEISATAADICKLLVGMTTEETFSSLSGTWRFTVVCDQENDVETLSGIHMALTLPDQGGKLFTALSSKFKAFSKSRVDLKAGTIKLEKLPGKLCIPYICRTQDSITIYTTPLAALRINQPQPSPRKKAISPEMMDKADLKGIGVFFCRNVGPGKILSPVIDMNTSSPSLSVLKKLPDGFLLEDISACDFNHYSVYSLATFPLQLIRDLFAEPEPQPPSPTPPPQSPPPKQTPRQEKKVKKEIPQDNSKKCLDAISDVGQLLLKEAKRSGKWESYGIAGLRALAEKKLIPVEMLNCPSVKSRKTSLPGVSYANCHYLYFGKPAPDSPKTPVLMEFPFLHSEYFAVFYADGSVKQIRLDGRRNVRRAISFLHTVHSYEEEEFMRLMQIASEFDKILER